ncbi:hypothetical protein AAY473_029462 [Plecturocebus cupreus]
MTEIKDAIKTSPLARGGGAGRSEGSAVAVRGVGHAGRTRSSPAAPSFPRLPTRSRVPWSEALGGSPAQGRTMPQELPPRPPGTRDRVFTEPPSASPSATR